jgi:hypothetical protein
MGRVSESTRLISVEKKFQKFYQSLFLGKNFFRYIRGGVVLAKLILIFWQIFFSGYQGGKNAYLRRGNISRLKINREFDLSFQWFFWDLSGTQG